MQETELRADPNTRGRCVPRARRAPANLNFKARILFAHLNASPAFPARQRSVASPASGVADHNFVRGIARSQKKKHTRSCLYRRFLHGGMPQKKAPRDRPCYVVPSIRGNFIRRYLRSRAIVSTSAPSLVFFFSLFISPSFQAPSVCSLPAGGWYASQERRDTVEQRTGINNPEFPAGVLIIRFQGPPILAEESYARERISPAECSGLAVAALLVPLLPSSRPTFVPLFFFPLAPSTFQRRCRPLRSLSPVTPPRKLCQQEQTKRHSHPWKCARHIYGRKASFSLPSKANEQRRRRKWSMKIAKMD